MSTTSIPIEHSEEGRAFLQWRVGRFGLYASCLGWFFLAFRLVEALLGGQVEQLFGPSLLWHALAAFSLTGIWIACRGRSRSARYVRTVEVLGVVMACSFYSAMGLYIPLIAMPHYIVVLAVGLGMIARAVYVPSSSRRTLVLTGLAGVPVLLSAYFTYHDIDVAPWIPLVRDQPDLTAADIAVSMTSFSAAWWLCIVLLCFQTSRVIYGLRKEARNVRKLGQYSLLEKLGEGGMGIVYRASHAMLRRPTAVKLLPAEKAGQEYVGRFEKEVQLTARLTHPNTVTIFDYGRTPEGIFYYAMELLDGATLADVVELDGPQPAARVAQILDQAAGALAEAHGINLIHRDVKPANIMLVEQGGKPDVAKMLDFGLVKELHAAGNAGLTNADAITGTPQYLPPEAIRKPDGVDARSDLYALGAVGYFLLTGEHVFTAETVIEVCSKHLNEKPIPPSERMDAPVPPDLEALLLECLEKDPDDRPRSARELQQRLHACRGLGDWSEEDARAWWTQQRPSLEALREAHQITGSSLTMAIALDNRGGK